MTDGTGWTGTARKDIAGCFIQKCREARSERKVENEIKKKKTASQITDCVENEKKMQRSCLAISAPIRVRCQLLDFFSENKQRLTARHRDLLGHECGINFTGQ